MGSIGARMPSAFGSSYLPAKAAMLSYSECVRQEVWRFGVKVCYVEPGFVETALLTNARANGAAHAAAATAGPRTKPTAADAQKAAGEGAASCDADDASRSGAYPSFEEKMGATAEMIRGVEKLNGGPTGVDMVVDATVDAICSRVPLTRYTVGYDALFMRYVGVWIPDRLIDVIQTYL